MFVFSRRYFQNGALESFARQTILVNFERLFLRWYTYCDLARGAQFAAWGDVVWILQWRTCFMLFVYHQSRCGHTFVQDQFNIYTVCEYCSSYIWVLEKAQVCNGEQAVFLCTNTSVYTVSQKTTILLLSCITLRTRSPASAGIANRPLVFLGIFLIFGSNTPTWSVENQLHYWLRCGSHFVYGGSTHYTQN